jgi:hypothetical protein
MSDEGILTIDTKIRRKQYFKFKLRKELQLTKGSEIT